MESPFDVFNVISYLSLNYFTNYNGFIAIPVGKVERNCNQSMSIKQKIQTKVLRLDISCNFPMIGIPF